GEGEHELSVMVSDLAGNPSTETVTFTVDTLAPVIAIDSPLSGYVDSTKPQFLYTIDDTALDLGSIVVTVDADVLSVYPGELLPALAQGAHTLTVSATDLLGHESSEQVDFVIDSILPVVTITEPLDGYVTTATPQALYSLDDTSLVPESLSVTLDGVAISLASGDLLPTLTEGAHALRIDVSDAAGNLGVAQRDFIVDLAGPTIQLGLYEPTTAKANQKLSGWVETGASVSVTVPGLDEIPVQVDGDYWFATVELPTAGSYDVTITATDPAGQISELTQTLQFDPLLPVLTLSDYLVSGNLSTQTLTGTVTLGATVTLTSGSGATFAEVVYDDWGGWSCDVSNLPVGDVIIEIVATEESGLQSQLTATLITDPLLPQVDVTTLLTPTAQTDQRVSGTQSADSLLNVVLISADGTRTTACSNLSNVDWNCSLSGLSDGEYQLEFLATSLVGSTRLYRSLVVDTLPPAVVLPNLPVAISTSTLTLVGDREIGAEVSLDLSVVATVAGVSYPSVDSWSCLVSDIPEGPFTVSVRGSDAAGNISLPVSVTLSADYTAPTVSVITPMQGSWSATATPTLSYSVDDVSATVEVEVDNMTVTVRDGELLAALADGPHTLMVRVIDPAGNSSFDEVSFYVDAAPPVVSIDSPADGETTQAPILIFTTNEGVVTVSVDAVVQEIVSGTPLELADGTHSVTLDVIDDAGNATQLSHTFTVDTVEPALTLEEVRNTIMAPYLGLEGVIEEGAALEVLLLPAMEYGLITLDGTLWNSSLSAFVEGENTLQITATDLAGNTTRFIESVTYAPPRLGSVDLSGEWQAFSFTPMTEVMVIIAGPPSRRDEAPGVVRLRQISSAAAEIRFQEWSTRDENHAVEVVDYLALQPGRYFHADGSVWEVGRISLAEAGDGTPTSFLFSETFIDVPALFLTVQSEIVGRTVDARLHSVSEAGFSVALQQAEASKNLIRAAETVGYLAVYAPQGSGSLDLGESEMTYLRQSMNVTEDPSSILSTALLLEEEATLDTEISHLAEHAEVMVLGNLLWAQLTTVNETDTASLRRSIVADSSTTVQAEWGSVSLVENEWTTLPLRGSYTQPVVVPSAEADAAGAARVVQLRNVTPTSFEVRILPWQSDGATSASTTLLHYLVAEAGRQMLAGLELEAGLLDTDGPVHPEWATVVFSAPFSQGAPALFAASQQSLEADPQVCRFSSVDVSSFSLTTQGRSENSPASPEPLGWIALAKGKGETDEGRSVLIFSATVGDVESELDLAIAYAEHLVEVADNARFMARYSTLGELFTQQPYLLQFVLEKPTLIGQLGTTHETDPAVAAITIDGRGTARAVVEEAVSNGASSSHAQEELNIFVAE
ncbi:MAG: hypothetical protein C0621_08350, partial [Desulfuromonas sp.]